eukprot:715010-Rhodomonas_salina.1
MKGFYARHSQCCALITCSPSFSLFPFLFLFLFPFLPTFFFCCPCSHRSVSSSSSSGPLSSSPVQEEEAALGFMTARLVNCPPTRIPIPMSVLTRPCSPTHIRILLRRAHIVLRISAYQCEYRHVRIILPDPHAPTWTSTAWWPGIRGG